MDETRAALHAAVKAAVDAGLCVVPPREDGTKAPEGYWKSFMSEPASIEILRDAYRTPRCGIGLVCGKVSGHLECLDFDTKEIYARFKWACGEAGLDELLERMEAGYSEATPNGFHLLYRCEPCGGCQKLARTEDLDTLIEIKAEGGYLIVAPTFGPVNPNGNYVLLSGSAATIPTITPEDRDALHRVARSFDLTPKVDGVSAFEPGDGEANGDGNRPGDAFIRGGTWDFLAGAGWTRIGDGLDAQGRYQEFWRRPGKDRGNSAILHPGSGLFYVFSSSTGFPVVPAAYNKFRTLVYVSFGGNFRAATKHVMSLGFKPIPPPPFVAATNGNGPVCRPLSLVVPRRTLWIWEPFLPLGKLVIHAGEPGTMKSSFDVAIAALITTGTGWAKAFGPRNVIFLNFEDDDEDGLAPRLMAAGADLDRCHSAPNDTGPERLALAAAETDPLAVVIDPFGSWATGEADGNLESQVRASLEPLRQLAYATGAMVKVNCHPNKQNSLSDALYRISGSLGGMVGYARVVLASRADGERRFVAGIVKSNIGPNELGVDYSSLLTPVAFADGPGLYPRVVFGDIHAIERKNFFSEADGEAKPSKTMECINAMRELLADGQPKFLPEIKSALVMKGFTRAAIDTARIGLGLETIGTGSSARWRLPGTGGPAESGNGKAELWRPSGSSQKVHTSGATESGNGTTENSSEWRPTCVSDPEPDGDPDEEIEGYV